MVQYKSSGLVLDFAHQPGLVEPGATELIDFSRYGTDGTFLGAGNPDWVDTTQGLHVMEYASGDYVAVTCPKLNFTSGPFSMVTRVMSTNMTGHQSPFSRGIHSTNGWRTLIINDGQFAAYTSQAAASQKTSTAAGAITVDTWYTLGLSRSGNSILVYVDGIDATNTVGVHDDPVTSDEIGYIGVRTVGGVEPFIGQISPLIQVYSFALTAAQHLDIYNQWKGLV